MNPQQLSPQELVQLCLTSQDQALWFEFVSRFRPLISGVVARSLRRWTIHELALVDDLTQDTFLKLCSHDFRALRDFHFEHENSLFGFLKTVASNVVQDYVRREYSPKHGGAMEQEDLDDMKSTLPARTSFSEDTHAQILIAEIQRCLEQELRNEPHFQRDITIFWLYYRFGLTAKAISQIPSIGLNVKGVESALLRLTRILRGRLDADPGHRSACSG